MALNPLWTVRNRAGQFLGRFRAKSASQAIDRLIESQVQQASTFKRSMPTRIRREDLTARCEK